MKRQMMKWMAVLLVMVMGAQMVSCSKEGGSGEDSDLGWDWVDPKTGVSDSLLNELANSVVMMSYMHVLYPKQYGKTDADTYWKALQTLANYIKKNNIQTRGIFSQGVCYVQFVDALQSAGKTHRAMLMGAISKLGYTDVDKLTSIFNDIVSNLNDKEFIYRYKPMDFWLDFSLGHLDDYAIPVYHAVLACNLESRDTPGQRVAEYLVDNNLREIDMTLSVAPKIIEAGVNLALGTSNDLIQNGKLAFDIVEANGQLAIDFAKGNLNAKSLSNAASVNLKLMSKALEEIVPESQDLLECITDVTIEQVQAFNEEVNTLINDYPDALSPEVLELFKKDVERILLSKHKLNKSVWYKDDLCIMFGRDGLGKITDRKAYLYKLTGDGDYNSADATLIAMMDYVEFDTQVDFCKVWIYPDDGGSGARSKDQTIYINLVDYKTLKIKGDLGYGKRARDLSGSWSIIREVKKGDYEIKYLKFSTEYYFIRAGELWAPGDFPNEGNQIVSFDDVTVTTKNKTTLHVEGKTYSDETYGPGQYYQEGRHINNETISFDIEDYKGKTFENCKITNVKVKCNYNFYHTDSDWQNSEFAMSVSKLPMTREWKNSEEIEYEFYGTVGEGIVMDGYYNWDYLTSGMSGSGQDSYYKNNSNNATITFTYVLPQK